MTEAQVGLLYNIAAALSRTETDKTKTLLKSYYLMRCKDVTRGYGLPDKHFSGKIRCPNCCIEWKRNTEIKVKPIKLTKRQKQRLKSRKTKESKKEYVRRKRDLLQSNEIEQICTFCRHSTLTQSIKPQKEAIPHKSTDQNDNSKTPANDIPNTNLKQNTKKIIPKNKGINVYANALDVFSLQNKNNDLATKEKPKVINNNKRKKDKFAGLCQKAVLASAKLKGKEESKQNKLNLFLKPSS